MAAIALTELTTKEVDGTGVFDELMSSVNAQLKAQHKAGRIHSSDFAKIYLGALDSVLQQSLAFLMGKQAADKQADLLTQQISNELLNNTLIQAQIDKLAADTALTDQGTSNAVITGANLTKTGLQLTAQTSLVGAQETKVIADELLTDKQTLKVVEDTLLVTQNTANAVLTGTVITKQGVKLDSEKLLLDQKTDTEKAQILDTVNATGVLGVIGKQKALFDAQIAGFARDAEQKAAKLAVDAWTIRSTVDPDTMSSPTGIADTDVTNIMAKVKAGIGA